MIKPEQAVRHIPSLLASVALAVALVFAPAAGAPAGAPAASACDYVPTWLITANSPGQHQAWHYFAGWGQHRSMLAWVASHSLPTVTVTIGNGGSCRFMAATAASMRQPAPRSGLTPSWVVAVRRGSPPARFSHKTFTGWSQWAAMMRYVSAMDDPRPAFGVPWNYTVITARWHLVLPLVSIAR